MPNPNLIGSVYDIPGYLAEKFPISGIPRAVANSALLPIDVGADLLRRGTYGAFGMEEAEPYKYSGERVALIKKGFEEAAEPVSYAMSAVSDWWDKGVDWVRDAMRRAGGIPVQDKEEASPELLTPTRDIHEWDGTLPPESESFMPPAEPEIDAPPGPASASASASASARATGGVPIPAGFMKRTGGGVLDAPPSPMASAPGALQEEPMPPRKSLADRYAELVGKIPQAGDGSLTPQQKAQLQLDFFLNLLANNKRGSTFLQNAGVAGLDVSGKARTQIERNRQEALRARQQAMEDAYRQVGLEGKDQEAMLADRKQRYEERRQAAADQRDQQRINLLERQLRQQGLKVEKTDQGLALVNVNTGQAQLIRDENGNPLRADTSTNPNIAFYKWLMEDEERKNLYLGSRTRGRGGSSGKDPTQEVINQALDLLKESMGEVSLEDAVQQVMRGYDIASGRVQPGPAKPATEADAHRQAQAAKEKGVPVEQINQRLRQWGYKEIK